MSASETFEIIVFCDSGSERHGDKRPTPVVQGFSWSSFNADDYSMGWTDYNRSRRLIREQAHVDAARKLVGDDPWNTDRHLGESVDVRESWTLRCSKCAEAVSVRGERLYPILTALREHGLSRIGLRSLSRRLGSPAPGVSS